MFSLKDRLKGHSAAVTCLAVSAQIKSVYAETLVATGAEDGTVRVWRLADRHCCALIHIGVDNDVGALCFHPLQRSLLVAFGTQIHAFNLNAACDAATQSLTVQCAQSVTGPWEDDIAALDVHATGRHLATADDTGAIHVMEFDMPTAPTTAVIVRSVQAFRGRVHDNLATRVRFRPCKPWECVSIGMDCQIMQWDFSVNRLMGVVKVQPSEGDDSNQLINPPLMHDLAVSMDDKTMAVACGDGSIVLLRKPDGKVKRLDDWRQTRIANAHRCAATSVVFLTGNNQNLVIVSGGDDGRLVAISANSNKVLGNDALQTLVGVKTTQLKVNAMAACPDGTILVVDHLNSDVYIISLNE